MLFQFAEDQEATVVHPLRLTTSITTSADDDDTRIYEVACIIGLYDIVQLELQAVINAEHLRMRDAVIEAKAVSLVSAMRLRNVQLQLTVRGRAVFPSLFQLP